MTIRCRNTLCIWIIVAGLVNLLAYTVTYGIIGGDAHNGHTAPGGQYFIRGHFLRTPTGQEFEVPRAVYVYSYIHSISLWVTFAAVLLSLLVLARPHILATMNHSGWMRGPSVLTLMATLIVIFSGSMTTIFTWDFFHKMSVADMPPPTTTPVR